MIGTYAQVIALISYGNEYLQTGNVPENFFPGNSSFHYARTVHFMRVRNCSFPFLKRRSHMRVFADNPLQWFYQLRQRGCKAIRLAIISGRPGNMDHVAINRSPDAGTWLIETIGANGESSYWTSEWLIVRKGPARRWNVRYTQVRERFILEHTSDDIGELATQLRQILKALIAFTKEEQLTYWTGTFSHALDAFDYEDPSEDYFHKDVIISRRYSLATRQLLFAAAKSWVFEGVGSWNDLSFTNPRSEATHKMLTRQLYTTTSLSLLVSVNSFQPYSVQDYA